MIIFRVRIQQLIIGYLYAMLFFTSCSGESVLDEGEEYNNWGYELTEGELSDIQLSIKGLPDYQETTTRAIPSGKKAILHDYYSNEMADTNGEQAGVISAMIRTEYDADAARATTRAFDKKQLFGKGSLFRMLVFKGAASNTVPLTTPIANVVCQVDATGAKASFVNPISLKLMKGDYVFICFPADDKYNTWTVDGKGSSTVDVGVDEDFVCLKSSVQRISYSNTTINLGTFKRYGFMLTVNMDIMGGTGIILKPTTNIPLKLSDDGSGDDGRIFNELTSFNLSESSAVSFSGSHTIEYVLKVGGTAELLHQSFTPETRYIIANTTAAGRKITIQYPAMTIEEPEGSQKEISAGKLTSETEIRFEAGKSYTMNVMIGKKKHILITFRNENGDEKKCIFACGLLYKEFGTGKGEGFGVAAEQCDAGWREYGGVPNGGGGNGDLGGYISSKPAKLYYFHYGSLNPELINPGVSSDPYAGTLASNQKMEDSRNQCKLIMGKKWAFPGENILRYWVPLGGQYISATGASVTKASTDYFPVDEQGNRQVWSSSNSSAMLGRYTPTDNRSRMEEFGGIWYGISSSGHKLPSSRKNSLGLFLPQAGPQYNGNIYGVASITDMSIYLNNAPRSVFRVKYGVSTSHTYPVSINSASLVQNMNTEYGTPIRCVIEE